MLPKFPWSRHLIMWPHIGVQPIVERIGQVLGIYPKHRKQRGNLMCWEESGGDLTSVQWGGPVWEVNWPSKDQEQAFVREPRQGLLRLTSSCKTSSRFPGQGKGEVVPGLGSIHIVFLLCCPGTGMSALHLLQVKHVWGCLLSWLWFVPVPAMLPFPSEDLWTKKAVDRFCGVQCGLFSRFCLLLPPLCYIH